MAIYKVIKIHILCDECDICYGDDDPPKNVPQVEAWNQAKADGWGRFKGRELCEECLLVAKYPRSEYMYSTAHG